jgi:hypothetical protein
MCDQCEQIDIKLEQYRRIARSIRDELTIERITQLIQDTVAEKAKVHPNK